MKVKINMYVSDNGDGTFEVGRDSWNCETYTLNELADLVGEGIKFLFSHKR